MLHWCPLRHSYMASSLCFWAYGLFKIELTQAKCKCLRHRTTARFIPTDRFPLVKHAWQRSFGNQDRASKAIASHLWNPLNCCLLDHPALKKVAAPVVDLTKPTPSISSGLGYHYIDKLIEEERQNGGWVKKFKDAKESLKNKELKAEKIAMITKRKQLRSCC